jgi:large subunit ribosomal protein L2
MKTAKNVILHPETLKVGDTVSAGKNSEIKVGNALALKDIPLGTDVHNVEFFPGKEGNLFSGTSAKILAKENDFVVLRLSSKEIVFSRKNVLQLSEE